MNLRELPRQSWKSHEKRRFLKDSTKIETESFDPESFKHDGFDDQDQYVEEYVPGLADEDRLEAELQNFTPPRLKAINGSPYQALAIRYGILWTLVQQPNLQMENEALLETVQDWQEDLIEAHDADSFPDDDHLLHLARAAVEYHSDIDDSELHLIYIYMQLHNDTRRWRHQHHTWRDFFARLSSVDRFPKVSRSEKPAHALDTIEKGLWSLQEQALVYEIVDPDRGDVVGIPEEYVDVIRDWLAYEISPANYRTMLEELPPFDRQDTLIEARDTFGVDTRTGGRNERRRESLVESGISPRELLAEVVSKEDLKEAVDTYGLDAHKRRSDEMIDAIVDYFERTQHLDGEDIDTTALYLDCYTEIADGEIDRVPPQLQAVVDEDDSGTKLEILFERATADIFEEVFNLEDTTLLGQTAGGNVADGEIRQDGQWLLWDNKRRSEAFKLGASTRAKIKDYIDTKNQQHKVEWFLIIAPDFADSVDDRAVQLEKQVGIDVRLVSAEVFADIATTWQSRFASAERTLPLSVFYGSGELAFDEVLDTLETQFA